MGLRRLAEPLEKHERPNQQENYHDGHKLSFHTAPMDTSRTRFRMSSPPALKTSSYLAVSHV